MFLSILKYCFFVSVILLLGQIPVGDSTVAKEFQGIVGEALAWSGQEIKEAKAFKEISKAAKISNWPNWLHSSREPRKPRTHREASLEKEKQNKNDPDEDVSPSDRESLLRLLE